MPYVMVDIEADGPVPGLYSMVSLGAVLVEDGLNRTFYATFAPISEKWQPDALKISGITRVDHFSYPSPEVGMKDFSVWLKEVCGEGRPIFISDNNGFDWMFVAYYFWAFLGSNPFGFSSQNLGSIYKGMQKNLFVNFKHLRKTKHTHHPVDDARGNAEAFLVMINDMGLKTTKDPKKKEERAAWRDSAYADLKGKTDVAFKGIEGDPWEPVLSAVQKFSDDVFQDEGRDQESESTAGVKRP